MWFVDTSKFKLANSDKKSVSDKIAILNINLPCDFQRKLRDLNFIGHYKATELRQKLLFHGLIVLKDVLDAQKYEHFLKFSLAIRILTDRKFFMEHVDIAQILIDTFINEIYGEHEIVFNVHMLHHLPAECRIQQGTLDDFSCFPFENNNQIIKELIHSSNRPLQQLRNRSQEINLVKDLPEFDYKKQQNDGVLSFNKMIYKGTRLDATDRNGFVLLEFQRIFKCEKFYNKNGIDHADGYVLLNPQNIFEKPVTSQALDIFGFKVLRKQPLTITSTSIQKKMFYMKTNFTKDDGSVIDHIFFLFIMTYYVVKFSGDACVGVVRKDWMLNEKLVRYPMKKASKVLDGSLSTDKAKWMRC